MRLHSLCGKLTQLRQLPLAAWPAFITGWMRRHKNGFVPCVLAGCRQTVDVPLREFYETYGYFCEHAGGRHELNYFLGKLKGREVFYDIGAFRGAYSAAVRRKVPTASLHVFEPMPHNAKAVRRVFEMNHFQDFKVNEVAVNDGSTLSGSVNEQDVMLRIGETVGGAAVKFASVTLDEYVAGGHAAPTVVKIDVEGFELEVLQGARQCLLHHRPRLWLEVHPQFLKAQGKSADAVLDLLRETGYTVSPFADFHLPGAGFSYHIWCEPAAA